MGDDGVGWARADPANRKEAVATPKDRFLKDIKLLISSSFADNFLRAQQRLKNPSPDSGPSHFCTHGGGSVSVLRNCIERTGLCVVRRPAIPTWRFWLSSEKIALYLLRRARRQIRFHRSQENLSQGIVEGAFEAKLSHNHNNHFLLQKRGNLRADSRGISARPAEKRPPAGSPFPLALSCASCYSAAFCAAVPAAPTPSCSNVPEGSLKFSLLAKVAESLLFTALFRLTRDRAPGS